MGCYFISIWCNSGPCFVACVSEKSSSTWLFFFIYLFSSTWLFNYFLKMLIISALNITERKEKVFCTFQLCSRRGKYIYVRVLGISTGQPIRSGSSTNGLTIISEIKTPTVTSQSGSDNGVPLPPTLGEYFKKQLAGKFSSSLRDRRIN